MINKTIMISGKMKKGIYKFHKYNEFNQQTVSKFQKNFKYDNNKQFLILHNTKFKVLPF